MPLTGNQSRELQEALLDAFNRAQLTRMVRFELQESLSQIADGENDTELVFNLVTWADRHDRVAELIAGAYAINPSNNRLQNIHDEHLSWYLEPPEEGLQPYKGLQYFDVSDADRFFGREYLTSKLVKYLQANRFLAVIGASGSGKSSVARAGIVSALQAGERFADGTTPPVGSSHWDIHIVTPTAHPLKALSASLTRGFESVTAQATLIDDMLAHTSSLDLFISRHLAASSSEHVLLLVDQFEELFTLCKEPFEIRQFIDNLLNAVQPVDDHRHHHLESGFLSPMLRLSGSAGCVGKSSRVYRFDV